MSCGEVGHEGWSGNTTPVGEGQGEGGEGGRRTGGGRGGRGGGQGEGGEGERDGDLSHIHMYNVRVVRGKEGYFSAHHSVMKIIIEISKREERWEERKGKGRPLPEISKSVSSQTSKFNEP